MAASSEGTIEPGSTNRLAKGEKLRPAEQIRNILRANMHTPTARLQSKRLMLSHFMTRQTLIRTNLIVIFGLLFSCASDKPDTSFSKVQNEIIDKADILTTTQEDSVYTIIKGLRDDIGSQIVVLTIDSIGKKSLEEFSFEIADSLRIGRATHNDGLLITISLYDRKTRIEVGTGLENIIKDEIAAEIIREDMAPKFREEKYGQGIYLAVARIAKLIRENEKLIGTEPRWK